LALGGQRECGLSAEARHHASDELPWNGVVTPSDELELDEDLLAIEAELRLGAARDGLFAEQVEICERPRKSAVAELLMETTSNLAARFLELIATERAMGHG
jgi:hypothetical protein